MAITFQWSDDYAIDSRIDGEHKRLFELANTVFAIEDPHLQLAKVKECVHELYEYLKVHFGNEEGLMEESAYPQYDAHVAQHKTMIRKMNELLVGSHNLDQLLSGLRHAMIDWVAVHIMKHDRQLGAHLRGEKSAPTAGAEDLLVNSP